MNIEEFTSCLRTQEFRKREHHRQHFRLFSKFLFCCFLLNFICFQGTHHCHNDDVGCDFEYQHHFQLLFSPMMLVVDGAVTNSNDTIAMFAFRQAFNNFTGSNWYSNNDPCGATSEFQTLQFLFLVDFLPVISSSFSLDRIDMFQWKRHSNVG
jgi:hypothetical protein